MTGHALAKAWLRALASALASLPQAAPKVLSGPGSAKLLPSELDALKAKRPLVVTDRGVAEAGMLGTLEAILSGAGVVQAVFDGVRAEPSFDMARAGLEAFRSRRCDAVVALGGGSVIDVAKAIRIGAVHDKPLEKFSGILRVSGRGLPLVCIPTTAGSGSEATAFAILFDSHRGRKATIFDPKILPDSAILDPSLTLGMPAGLAASCAADALSLAVEAYANTLRRSDVDSQAVEAARLILSNLPKVLAAPEDLRAREALLRAANLAGRSFSRGFGGYVHLLAHRFWELYGCPCGIAKAIALPYVLDLYAEADPHRLAGLARATGTCAETGQGEDEECSQAFIERIRTLFESSGLPDRADFLKAQDVPRIAEETGKEILRSFFPVPAVFSVGELGAGIAKMLHKGE
ncbi:MAG: iron-containing alcohol dehydrogenase [Spirochaetota bacterium]